MQIEYHKQYKKSWAKLTPAQKQRVLAAIELFKTNTADPRLRLHQLKGEYYPQYSLSAGGDLRVHFSQIGEQSIILMTIGTHAQLYG